MDTVNELLFFKKQWITYKRYCYIFVHAKRYYYIFLKKIRAFFCPRVGGGGGGNAP